MLERDKWTSSTTDRILGGSTFSISSSLGIGSVWSMVRLGAEFTSRRIGFSSFVTKMSNPIICLKKFPYSNNSYSKRIWNMGEFPHSNIEFFLKSNEDRFNRISIAMWSQMIYVLITFFFCFKALKFCILNEIYLINSSHFYKIFYDYGTFIDFVLSQSTT